MKYRRLHAEGVPLYIPNTDTSTQAEQAELAEYFLNTITTKATELRSGQEGKSAADDEAGQDYYRFFIISFISLIASLFFIGINVGLILIEISRYWFNEKQLKLIRLGLFALFIALPFMVGTHHFEMESIIGAIVNWGYFYQTILAAIFTA